MLGHIPKMYIKNSEYTIFQDITDFINFISGICHYVVELMDA